MNTTIECIVRQVLIGTGATAIVDLGCVPLVLCLREIDRLNLSSNEVP